MHQHVGMVFTRGRLLQNGHQLAAVFDEERLKIVPLMQRRHERPDLAIACLMVRQQLELIAAVKIKQRPARQAVGPQGVQFVKGKQALDKIFPQNGSCRRPSSSTGSHG